MEFAYLVDRPDAIPTLATWYFNQWGYLNDVSSVDKTVKILQHYLNQDKLPLIILAIQSGEVIGAVQLKFYEMDIYPEKEHWLGGVYVSADYRKRKIGAKLVRKAVEIAKSHNIETLYLQTEKLDGGLYKSLGWKPIETVDYKNKKVLVMKIQL